MHTIKRFAHAITALTLLGGGAAIGTAAPAAAANPAYAEYGSNLFGPDQVGYNNPSGNTDANDLTVTITETTVTYHDANHPIEARTGCTQIDPNTAECATTGPKGLLIIGAFTGEGDDQITVTGGHPETIGIAGGYGDDLIDLTGFTTGAALILVNGEFGNDLIYGSPQDDQITGGDGVDEIHGGDGNDALISGACCNPDPGGDVLYGDNGDDQILGTDGPDTFYGGPGNDSGYLGGGNDIAHGGTGVDVFHGENGNDTLNGDEDQDLLYGEDGNDTLTGGSGIWNDIVEGGNGNDTIEHKDGTTESVVNLCGAGTDTARVDLPEFLTLLLTGNQGCETFTFL